jgi:putative heme-binding domain-containing protein
MRSLVVAVTVLVLVLLAVPGRSQKPDVAVTPHLSPDAEKKTFKLPPGFEVQLVAAEPDIHKPLNIAFDDQGRLWVSDTVEYPFAAKPGTKPRDTVKVLEDFGPDGRARKITTFADGLNIPIGILPLPGDRPRDALSFSIPNIYRLRDSMGKGVADKRELFYGTYQFRDTHGMTSAFTLGFDGWVYACHGYANTSKIKGADGKAVTMNSGNTYRFRPDGSHLEQWTWGQVNPFGLSLDPWGNLYSADCHSQPIYQLLRGGWYPSFGKPHDGLGFAPEMFTNYRGSTAIAGIAFYAADGFPERWRQSAFIGDVMTNQIVEFRMNWHGSTPRATAHVFLDSDDPWFRPVDIKLGPDGALYIADFYNRIIGHYEVPLNHPGRDRTSGRIWRIVYSGKDHMGTPSPRQDWTKASINELLGDLAHPNLTVRMLATHELVHRGKDAIDSTRAALASKEKLAHGDERDSHAFWVLERLGALDDETLKSCSKRGAMVRNHIQRILAGRKTLTDGQLDIVDAGLKDPNPRVQRAAADALGQHPETLSVGLLLELRRTIPTADTHLLHVVRMALRNQLLPPKNAKEALKAMMKLEDQLPLIDVALGVPSAESAQFLLDQITRNHAPGGSVLSCVHHVARYASADDMKALVSYCRTNQATNLSHQAALVRAVEAGSQERGTGLSSEARAWAVETVDHLLASKNEDELRRGLELMGILKLRAQQARIVSMATARDTSRPVRQAALNALAAIDASKYADTLGKVLTDIALPLATRQHAAGLLARANQPATLEQLATALATAPAQLQHNMAEGLASTREGGEKLLELVASGKASARLLQEQSVTLRLALAAKLPNLKPRLEKLTAGLPAADAKLHQLIADRRKGFLASKADAAKGGAVFEKHCAICHQLSGKGAKIGPQLDGIGLRGLDRLLEDTLDPNRNVDQAFRMTSLTLKKGQIVQGLLLREEGAVLVMADDKGKEVRIASKDVDERNVSQMSPMPADLGKQIPETDFYHLMAYLLAQKPAKR